MGIVLLRVFTTIFTHQEYGHYNIVLSTLGLVKVFSIVWLSTSAIRFYQQYKKEERLEVFTSTLFYAILVSSLLIAVIVFIVNLFVLKHKFDPGLFSIINIAIVASIFIALFEVFVIIFRADLKPQKYTFFWLLYVVGKPVLALFLIFGFGMRVSAIFWGFLFVPFVLFFALLKKLAPISLALKNFASDSLKQFFRYGLPIAFSNLAFWFLSMFDRYLLEIFRGSSDVGLYAVGYSISEKTLQFTFMTLMLAAYPVIVEHWESRGAEPTQHLISAISRYYLLLLTPMLVVLVAMPKDIFLIFADSNFLPGARVLPFIAGGFYLLGLSQYVLKSFELKQRSLDIARIALLAAFVNVGCNIFLIPRMGYMGAAVSSLTSYVVYFTLAVVSSQRILRWRISILSLGRVLVAAVVMGLGLHVAAALQINPFIKVLVLGLGSIVVYAGLLIFLGEITKTELASGYRFARRLLARNNA